MPEKRFALVERDGYSESEIYEGETLEDVVEFGLEKAGRETDLRLPEVLE